MIVGGLMITSLFTHFSVAQNYGPVDSNLINRILNFLMPNYAVYLYAITEPNTYTIYFDGNGSTSWSMGSMSMIYDNIESLLENNFTKDWFVFGWWSSSKTWMVEYLDQAEVKNLTADNWWEVILYAQRAADVQVPYTIGYYQENVVWTWYDLVDTSIEYGPAGTWIILTGKEYTWFTLQTWIEISINSDWIVPYYYIRNTYNLIVKDRDSVLLNTWVKYEADIILTDVPTWWTGNTFSWWDNLPVDMKMPANDLEIISSWIYGEHSITFDTDWWSEIDIITGNYGDPILIPSNPTKTGYEFVWWKPKIPTTMPYDDVTVVAMWKEVNEDSWSGSSGRWRSIRSLDISAREGWHGAATGQNQIWDMDKKADLEVFFAYMWARDMWIIETSWKDSDPDGYVTRWAMAEMVVKFSEKILKKEIPVIVPEQCAWWDAESEWKIPETKIYAKKACALWVMWIRMKDFMPNKILDRAEFGTILSRLLWWGKYDVVNATKKNPYYTKHLEALSRIKIMTEIENPEKKKELRKWAWLMLMRSRLENIEGK